MAVRLIDGNDLVKGTPLRGNVDADNYLFIIDDMQITILEPLIGTNLYDKILVDFDANTLTGLYSTLYTDYIKPLLVHCVFADFVTTGAYRVENAGIFKHTPNNAENISKTEIDFLAKTQRVKADVYIERLKRFLCTEGQNIPEYLEQLNNYDETPSNNDNIIGGWYL